LTSGPRWPRSASARAGMVKWYHESLPSSRCGFDSRYPLQEAPRSGGASESRGIVRFAVPRPAQAALEREVLRLVVGKQHVARAVVDPDPRDPAALAVGVADAVAGDLETA